MAPVELIRITFSKMIIVITKYLVYAEPLALNLSKYFSGKFAAL